MNTFKTTILALALATGGLGTQSVWAASPSANDAHHVMWTNSKGQEKCCDKKNKDKADRCAARLKRKGATDVQVMVGRCRNM